MNVNKVEVEILVLRALFKCLNLPFGEVLFGKVSPAASVRSRLLISSCFSLFFNVAAESLILCERFLKRNAS